MMEEGKGSAEMSTTSRKLVVSNVLNLSLAVSHDLTSKDPHAMSKKQSNSNYIKTEGKKVKANCPQQCMRIISFYSYEISVKLDFYILDSCL